MDADVEHALAVGTVVRTHVLRPTWHLVARDDIRWMLDLTAPRVRAAMASNERQFGLDARTKTRARAAVARALADEACLTRAELASALQRAKIPATGTPLASVSQAVRSPLRWTVKYVPASLGQRTVVPSPTSL